MRRREFITLLGGTAAAWPLEARAQQAATPVIGFLGTGEPDNSGSNLTPFHRGLAETGYVEGRNVAVEYRGAADRLDRLPIFAEDLARRQVNAIAAVSSQAAIAAGRATKSIPIAFAIGSDPVEIGLVGSLNRPGGNITGIYSLLTATAAKRLELLHELLPAATTIGFLGNPTDTVFAEAQMKETLRAAGVRGVRLLIVRKRPKRVRGSLRDSDTATGEWTRGRRRPIVQPLYRSACCAGSSSSDSNDIFGPQTHRSRLTYELWNGLA
jgi:putative ABC transport system substrate-binding protein